MRQQSLSFMITIFVVTLIAWFFLLGLWIYYFITNYLIFEQVGDSLSPQLIENPSNLFPLITGLILLLLIFIAIISFFVSLYRNRSLAESYDNFIANVTHELKSPLSSIQLYIETMQSREISKEQQSEFIDQISHDIKRLHKYINSILYLSGFQNRKLARRYPHDYQIYQADAFFREMIKETANELNISDRISFSGDAPVACVIDKHWMKIAIDNLLENAKKYSDENLMINIYFSHSAKQFQLAIQDNGIGIPKDFHKKVFDKFVRVQTAESPSVKGTGLGLYWVKEIIRYHGGKIRLTSEGSGKGTMFIITLPIFKMHKQKYIDKLLQLSKKYTRERTNHE
ncbi:MAG: HAMP domain-containing sensor histidine kinase [Calditrichia bacterium]